MPLRIHGLIFALNEEPFIANQLQTLYPFCSGISVLTQYDRDWYGKPVNPDRTLELVANFPDPEGKIHLVLRRWRDQAAALNCEIAAVSSRPANGVISHGTPIDEIARFHATPDYFWIVDSDEIYDPATIPQMLHYLEQRRPRGMRVHGYNYLQTWNRRVPMHEAQFCQFGFVRPSIRFTSVRTVTWNESRLRKLLRLVHLPDFSASLFGFVECPPTVALFHHGCWLGSKARLRSKGAKSAHQWHDNDEYPTSIQKFRSEFVSRADLPTSIKDGDWPVEFWDVEPGYQKQQN